MMTCVTGSAGDVPLVGRERELAVLDEAVTRAAAGTPGAVLITGDAGIGKSRLVRALLQTLPTEALVLRSQCVDLGEPGLPHLVVVDLVRSARAYGAPEVDAVLARHPVVTALSDSGDSASNDEAGRLRLLDATARLVADLGHTRSPVVLVVEDLHWVDVSSADALRFLISRAVDERVAVVATVRTDGLAARPRVRSLLGELTRLPWVQRLDLAPFDLAEVTAYLRHAGAPNPDEVASVVLGRTGGNPYFVHTLAASPELLGRAGPEIPPELADVIVGRLDRLPGPAREVVRAVAVAGSPVADPVLRRVLDPLDAGIDEAVRVAVAEGLVVGRGPDYSVPHDLMRTAVYDDLLPAERIRLHAAYGAALAKSSAAAAEIAHHLAAAQDRPGTVLWSVRAGEEALRALAPSDALVHLDRALSLWHSVEDAAALTGRTQGSVALAAARAAGLAGEPSRAIEEARRAIRLLAVEGDTDGGVEARAELARRLVEVDAGEEAVAAAEEAVRMAEQAEPGAVMDPTLATARVMLARSLLAARQIDAARVQADHALAAARQAGAPALQVEALTTAAFLDEIDGDLPSSAARLGSALRVARTHDEPAAELRAHYALASMHYYNGDVTGALPVLDAAMQRVVDSGLRWSGPGVELRLLQAVARYVAGDFAGSLHAADAPESPPPDVAAVRLAAVACYAAVAAGRPDAASRLATLRPSWDADPQVALVAGGCEADLLTWAGDTAGAVAVAEQAQDHLDAVVGEGMYGGLWLAALALGALADAAEQFRRHRDDAGLDTALARGTLWRDRIERLVTGGRGRPGDLGPEGRAWVARGVAEHARLTGAPDVEAWRRAVTAFDYGHAYEQARCRRRLAEALVLTGDRGEARLVAQEAAAAAERMHAVPLQQSIAALVARARLAPSATGIDGVLTEREREVLALVAEGLTNREIGKRLFISDKTASVHLSNVMTKLNASSRTEAVTVAQRRGLLDVLGGDRA